MWTHRKTLLATLVAFVAAGGVYVCKPVWGKPFVFSHEAERVLVGALLDEPEACTHVGLVDGTLLDFHGGKLADASPRQSVRLIARAKRELKTLMSYDRERLNAEEQITFDAIRYFLEGRIGAEVFPNHMELDLGPAPFRPTHSMEFKACSRSSWPPSTQSRRRSARRYLARLEAVPAKFDQLLESLQMRESMGVVPPRFILGRTLRAGLGQPQAP